MTNADSERLAAIKRYILPHVEEVPGRTSDRVFLLNIIATLTHERDEAVAALKEVMHYYPTSQNAFPAFLKIVGWDERATQPSAEGQERLEVLKPHGEGENPDKSAKPPRRCEAAIPDHAETARALAIGIRYTWNMSESIPRIAEALTTATRNAERAAYKRAAQECDNHAQGCRNIAETIKEEWMGPEIPAEDRRANAQDRREHLARVPIYEAMARTIRALSPDHTPEEEVISRCPKGTA